MKAIQLGMFMFGALSLAACGVEERTRDGGNSDGDSDSDSTTDDSDDAADDTSMTEKKCNKMDIIFIVDDSGSMDAEQGNLAQNFPQFAQILDEYVTADGDALDYRIAVTTTGKPFTMRVNGGLPITETGPDGTFSNTCNLTKRWIEPTDPDMQTTLTCRAAVGTGGSGMEMPLLMTKRAVEKTMGGDNAGFMRADALLAVVILTDEDDSSSTVSEFDVTLDPMNFPPNPEELQPPIDFNPSDLVAYLDGVKGNRTKWAAGVIAGDPPAGATKCSGGFGDASAAPRLKEFVMLANSQGTTQAVFSSICQPDLTQGLQAALTTFQSACEVIVQ